jgi:DNA primase
MIGSDGKGRDVVDLGEFLDREIYPALFSRLDLAFPEFGWVPKGGNWVATEWPNSFPYGAQEQRPDRLMVYADRPWWVKVHGHAGVRFLDLVNGGRRPDGAEFVAAVRELADRAGVRFPEREPSAEEVERVGKREARRSVLESVIVHCQQALWSERGEAARAYLRDNRGLTDEEVRELGLGLYPDPDEVRAVLEREGHDARVVQYAGVVWDKLEGYVIVPWGDADGHPLTLCGRWPAKDPPPGRPKTIGLPGEGTKGSPLGFHLARQAGHRDLVCVEGIFDVLLPQARGDTRVVGCMAAQLTNRQVETLQRYRVRTVTLCLDPDRGGDRGTIACIESLSHAGIAAYVAPRLPDGLDPDEFVLRHGIEAWRAHIERAVSGAIFRTQQLLGDVSPDSPDIERRAAVDRVLDFDAGLRGDRAPLDREDLLHLAAERTGYSYEALAELAEDHADRRRREASERQLSVALRDAQDGLARREDVLGVTRSLANRLAVIAARTVEQPPAFSVERLDRNSAETSEGKPSGWAAVDEALDVRFNAGELTALAARTGHGKTAVVVGLTTNWLRNAERAGTDEVIVFYSMEEPEIRIYHRLLALLTAGDEEGRRWTSGEVRDYLRNRYSRDSWPDPKALDDARNRLRAWEDRLLVVHRPAWTVVELEAHARDLAEHRPLGGILVDYLQRIPPPPGSFDRRDIEVSAVARRLHDMAVSLGVPVVAAAQINRDAVKDGNKIPEGKAYDSAEVRQALRSHRPKLHHLREGGSEQEADVVLGLMNHRADFEEDVAHRSGSGSVPEVTLLEVGTLKNRYGTPGR